MDLFSLNEKRYSPLADRMRPETLEEFVGQTHIIFDGSLLMRAIKTNTLGSCIFYGKAGTGKTTLANIIANTLKCNFYKLNSISSGVTEMRKIIEESKNNLLMFGKKSFVLLDECHRWNKAQLDSVLEAMEKGYITLIGSTTENPYIALTPAIISRCRVFEFKKIEDKDLEKLLDRAITDNKKGLGSFDIDLKEDAKIHLIKTADGDARNLLNAIELAVLTTKPNRENKIVIDLKVAEQCIQRKALSIDDGLYYDLLSAFCKSLRGSDSDAAVYYALRLIDAGLDPLLIARRLVVHSSEDVGMADPNALVIATSALTALKNLGLPEGKIPLVNAIIYVCEAEKSNSVVRAIEKVENDLKMNKDDDIPPYLRDGHYKGAENRMNGETYLYPHDFGGYVKQQYLPDSLKDREYYTQSNNGFEKGLIKKKNRNK